ncbi:hypothetical protein OAS39_07945 [Pirellulales bacterium]|nr:hypothetical protein [Pirellulales bacterium]
MNVKETIRQLLNVAASGSNATEGEIRNALAFAEKFMADYQLSEADLVEEPVDQYQAIDEAEMKRNTVYTGGARCATWEMDLGMFCAKFVGGVGTYADSQEHVRTPHGTIELDEAGKPITRFAIKMYGAAEAVMLTCELFNNLRPTIASMALLKHGTIYRGPGRSYAEGFVCGLRDQLDSQRRSEKQLATQSSDTNALVLIERRADLVKYKKDHARKWLYEHHGLRLCSRSSGSGGQHHGGAFAGGRSDGQRTNVKAATRRKLTSA